MATSASVTPASHKSRVNLCQTRRQQKYSHTLGGRAKNTFLQKHQLLRTVLRCERASGKVSPVHMRKYMYVCIIYNSPSCAPYIIVSLSPQINNSEKYHTQRTHRAPHGNLCRHVIWKTRAALHMENLLKTCPHIFVVDGGSSSATMASDAVIVIFFKKDLPSTLSVLNFSISPGVPRSLSDAYGGFVMEAVYFFFGWLAWIIKWLFIYFTWRGAVEYAAAICGGMTVLYVHILPEPRTKCKHTQKCNNITDAHVTLPEVKNSLNYRPFVWACARHTTAQNVIARGSGNKKRFQHILQ